MSTDNPNGPSDTSTVVRPRRTHQRVVLLGVAILSVSGFFMFQRQAGRGGGGTKQGQGQQAPRAVPITVATAQKGDIGEYVNALGYVTPVYTVTVRTRVDGELLKVNYKEGEIVRQGSVLAEIDPRLFQAQVLQAQGQYDRDKALLDEAYIDLARFREAYARNAIPKQTLDIQQATVHEDEGTLKIDQGQVDNARVNLQYCTVTSPITGRVGLRLLDPGNIVHAADANGIAVITQLQPITVVFSVAEDYLSKIQSQLKIGKRLPVDALDRAQLNKLGSGTVTAVDNQIDATTGTVRIRATFGNEGNALFPNQFVNSHLLLDTQHGVTLIPTSAIQRNGDTAFVYVIGPDDVAKVRNITVGISHEDVSAVDGVNPGEVVATDGFDKLQDGVKVTVQQGNGDQTKQNSGQQNQNNSYGQQGNGQQNGSQGGQQNGTQQSPAQQGNQPNQQNNQQNGQQSGQQGGGRGPGGHQ